MDNHTPEDITWDAEDEFLHDYRRYKRRLNAGDSAAYAGIRLLRRNVYANTIEAVMAGGYRVGTTTVSIDAPSADSEFYSREQPSVWGAPTVSGTLFEVVNADCLDVARRLVEKGERPAVLNMANRHTPGGGVMNGAGAQEESIFRRTDLFRWLYPFSDYAEVFGLKSRHEQYPLDRNFGGIYTPSVTVFREGESEGYELMEQPFVTAVITVAGLNRPDLTPDGRIIAPQVAGLKNKIRTILRAALHHGHTTLVLGALGCGAFRNPPAHVAEIFRDVFAEDEFVNRFRRIVFAILDDHNAHLPHNPDGNFLPFARLFSAKA